MGWKSVAWAVCLLPVLTGCGAVRNLTTDVCLNPTQRGIERKLRKEAEAAWRTVCSRYARRTFTEDFHEGFLDGYVEYLDHGGAAQPPARSTGRKRYSTPEGNCLLRDYQLGFKYGVDVAVTIGRREFLTGPVQFPDAAAPVGTPLPPGPPVVPMLPPSPGKSPDTLPSPRPVPGSKPGKPGKSDDPPSDVRPPLQTSPGIPDSTGRLIPPLPKPEVPIIPPFNPDLTDGGKFTPPLLNDPDLLPVPKPPLPSTPLTPIPVPTGDSPLTIPPIQGPPLTPIPVPSMKMTLSESSAGNVSVPGILDAIPVIPFIAPTPAPLPVGGPSARK